MEVNSSDFRDPTYLTHAQHDRNVNFSSLQVPAEYQNLVETQAEVEGEVLNLADFHTPGGSSGRVKSKIKENLENLVSLDLPSSNPNAPAIQPHILKDEKILKNLQFLLHLFNYNLKQVCQTIAELYVDTAFNPAIRSQADYLEGKSLFYSKMTEFYNLQKFINKILTQNYQKTWNQINRKHENFDKILTDKLFPYYQQHHLNKIINQPRSQTLEQNDYMFFAYYNEKYLDQAGLLHGNLKSMIGALATIFDNHFENFCVTHHESELADEYQTLIAPLLNREITDMQVYFILKKLEKMEDDKFFDLIKGNEMAIEKIRGIKYGKFYLAEDAPMRVPPLVRVGNNLGGYIFKTPYNRHYYDNIERIKMDKEFDDLKLDSYKGISNCEAKELRGWGKCFIMRKKLERTSNVASKRRQKGTRKA